jgi:hypothetical protein
MLVLHLFLVVSELYTLLQTVTNEAGTYLLDQKLNQGMVIKHTSVMKSSLALNITRLETDILLFWLKLKLRHTFLLTLET